MKKLKPATVSFTPTIQARDIGDAWAISFDSGSTQDLLRASRTVFVKKDGIKQLEVNVAGFNMLGGPGAEGEGRAAHSVPTIYGRILLLVTHHTDSTDTYVLAECEFTPWSHHEGNAPVGDVARAVRDVAHVVRNSTTEAFTTVLPDLFPTKSEGPPESFEVEGAVPRTARSAGRTRSDRVRSFGQRAHASRFQRWMPWLAVAGMVAVVWGLLSIFGRPAHSPEQAALAASGPNVSALQLPQATGADAQAQVELVKSTLKSMGLDPGASGDTGCLVQPQ